jgi:hypothetical protein
MRERDSTLLGLLERASLLESASLCQWSKTVSEETGIENIAILQSYMEKLRNLLRHSEGLANR